MLAMILQLVLPAGVLFAGTANVTIYSTYAQDITSNSANVRYSIGDTCYWKLEYGLSSSSSYTSTVNGYHTNGSVAWNLIPLTGLSQNTSYKYRFSVWPLAYPSPTAGQITYAPEGAFSTTEYVAPPADTTAPTATGLSGSAITEGSATVQFSIDEAGYGKIEYGPNNTFSQSTSETAMVASAPATFQLTGLLSSTTYSYRAVARDSMGNTSTSYTWSFTTLTPQDTTPPSVSGGSISGITSSSASVYTSVNENSYVKVEYGPSGSFSMTSPEVYMTPGGSSTVFVPLTGLTPVTIYSYRLVARDMNGNITTTPAGAFETLSSSTTNTNNSTSGTAGLRVVVRDSSGTLLSGAAVGLSSSTWSNVGTGYTATDGSYTFSNLASGSYYLGVSPPSSRSNDLNYVTSYVVTLTSGATSNQEISLTAKSTTTSTAPTITNVRSQNILSTSLDITWGSDQSVYGRIEYGTTQSYGTFTAWTTTLSTSPVVTLTGLAPLTTYYIRAYAQNSAGVQNTASVTTTAVTAVSQDTQTPTTGIATVKVWVKSVIDNSTVSGAMISLGSTTAGSSGYSSGTSGSDGSYTFTNLSAGSYNIGVSPPTTRTDLGYMTNYPITLVSGSNPDVNITLPRSTTTTGSLPSGTAHLRVTVKAAPDNAIVSGSSVWLSQSSTGASTGYGGYGSASGYTGVDGTYTFSNIAAGTYQLSASPPSSRTDLYSPSGVSVTLTSSVTSSTDIILSRTTTPSQDMTAPVIGSVSVVMNTQAQVQIMWNTDDPTVGKIEYGLTSSYSNNTEWTTAYAMTQTGFLYGLTAGSTYYYRVRVRNQSGLETLSSAYTFIVGATEPTQGGATITGGVKDSTGSPVAYATVTARSSFSGSGYWTTQTNNAGEYTLSNVSAGSVMVEVYSPSSAGNLMRPASEAVELTAGATKTVNFVFKSSTAMIRGKVVFSDGTPVADGEVSAYRRDSSGGWVSASTTQTGDYSLTVSSGIWMVSLRPRGGYGGYGTWSYATPQSTATWVYTQPAKEISVESEGNVKVVDFTVPAQTLSTTVSGVVTRSDGEYIPAGIATVRLIGTSGTSITAGVTAGGRFFTSVTPGTYKLYVDVSDSALSSPDIAPIAIASGEQKDIGNIVLSKAGLAIDGQVTTFDGKSVSGVKVSAWKMNSSDTSYIATDVNGRYSLRVSPGDWTVGLHTASTATQEYTTAVRPQFVKVGARSVGGINFVIVEAGGGVAGVVKKKGGEVLGDVYGFISVTSKSGERLPMGAPIEHGAFNVRLPNGVYILKPELPGTVKYTISEPVVVEIIGNETKNIEIFVNEEQSAAIVGYLVDSQGEKVINVPFKVFASGSNGGWYSAQVDTIKGYYKLSVPAGTWFIGYDIDDTAGKYHRSKEDRKITVKSGQIESVDLAVTVASGEVSGTIVDMNGKPVSGVWVAISSQGFAQFTKEAVSSLRYLNGVTSDTDGAFRFLVKPGTYYVRAFVPPSFGFTNPEEQKVSVSGDEPTHVTLTLRSKATVISGKVTIAGVPTWGFVWAWSNKGGYVEGYAKEDGVYTLKVAGEDVWHIVAMTELKRDTYKSSETAIKVVSGKATEVQLDLSPLGVKLPEPVTASADPDQMTVVTGEDRVKVVMPPNAVGATEAVNLSITPQVITPSQGADRVVGFGYEIEVRTQTGQEVNTFNSELTVSVPYNPVDMTRFGLVPRDLSLRYWDETSSAWQEITNSVVDEVNHVVTGSVAHLTRFAIIARTDTAPPADPQKVKVRVTTAGIALAWENPKDKDLKYIKLYRSKKSGVIGDVVANEVSGKAYTDSGVPRGATYFYTVRAVDKAGNESANIVQSKIAVKGKGLLGKVKAKALSTKVQATIKGVVTDVRLANATLQVQVTTASLKVIVKKTIVLKIDPKLKVVRNGIKVSLTALKKNDAIDAKIMQEGTTYSVVSATLKAAKTVAVKGSVKGVVERADVVTEDMGVGSRGEQVKAVQGFLKKFGSSVYPQGLVTGVYGDMTQQAVREFQLRFGLANEWSEEWGSVSGKTRQALNELMKE